MRRENFRLFHLSAAITTAALVIGCGGVQRLPEPRPSPSPSVTATPSPTTPTPPSLPVTPQPNPTPIPIATAIPSDVFVKFGAGSHASLKIGGVDYAYGQKALKYINDAVASGCVLDQVLKWDFESLHGVMTPALRVTQRLEAYQRFIGCNASPCELDAGWYTSSWVSRNVVGYTYNCYGGIDCETNASRSETRIWTNTRINLSVEDYAAHLSHELSHQLRAGGFVHWSFHQGSFPYEIGDIVSACIRRMQADIAVKSLVAVVEATVGRPSAKGKPLHERSHGFAHEEVPEGGCTL